MLQKLPINLNTIFRKDRKTLKWDIQFCKLINNQLPYGVTLSAQSCFILKQRLYLLAVNSSIWLGSGFLLQVSNHAISFETICNMSIFDGKTFLAEAPRLKSIIISKRGYNSLAINLECSSNIFVTHRRLSTLSHWYFSQLEHSYGAQLQRVRSSPSAPQVCSSTRLK